MDDQPPPPPYSAHDPHSPSVEMPRLYADTSPIRTSLRGGYLNIVDDAAEPVRSSAAAYIQQRPLLFRASTTSMLVERTITPRTTRDDLLAPHNLAEFTSHDVSPQDWLTFVNHVVAELERKGHENKAKVRGPMSLEEFRDCRARIEAVVAEWNEGFFNPRWVRITIRFSDAQTARAPSPGPSCRTVPCVPPSFPGGALAYSPYNTHPSVMPPHPPPFPMPMHHAPLPFPPTFHHAPFMRVVPPHFTQPSRLPLPGFVPGRFSKPWDDGEPHRGRHGRRGGPGRHHRHRSASTVSSSSSSSSSSASSLSSNDIDGVNTQDIQQSLTNFRLNPSRKDHIHAAVRQLHAELRSHPRIDGSPLGRREMKAELKAQKRVIKTEVKQAVKEAKGQRKEGKKQRKAEKKVAKAEKHLRKVERRVYMEGFGC